FQVRSESGRYLAVQSLSESQPIRIPGTDNAVAPFFSPDGNWLGFSAGGKIMKVSLAGGAPIVLCDGAALTGATWNERGIHRRSGRVHRTASVDTGPPGDHS